MRGVLRVAALASVLVAGACTSLLGDFTLGPGTGPDAGATSDASMSDASRSEPDASDAGTPVFDAEAGSGQLSCSTWRWTLPIVVEDLSTGPSRLFTGRFA